jgi:ABC-2 type transport system ATP-binding protein
MSGVVECYKVSKRYGEIIAVNDVSFAVREGEIFGLVGPNGAGKTTLIEMIESLRRPDSGSIRVLGLDPVTRQDQLQERIGVQLQTTSIQPNIRIKEAIRLFAGFYNKPLIDPDTLLSLLFLEDKGNSRFKKLSGGQKQRVAIALAMVNDPEVLFFDELTTGLDPQARSNMWQLVKDLRSRGKTVFLTTHYMEEAQALCDRVGIIDHGRVISLDTPANLIRNLSADSKVTFQTQDNGKAAAAFQGLPTVSRVERIAGGFALHTRDSDGTLMELVRLADRRGFIIKNIHTEVPNLDDVFLALTGRELRE